jgi:hypothetical protein
MVICVDLGIGKHSCCGLHPLLASAGLDNETMEGFGHGRDAKHRSARARFA